MKKAQPTSVIGDIVARAAKTPQAQALAGALGAGKVVEVASLTGSSYALYAAAVAAGVGGVHIFVATDRDEAAYLCGDFYAVADKERVLFLSSSYKRSIRFGAEDQSGVV